MFKSLLYLLGISLIFNYIPRVLIIARLKYNIDLIIYLFLGPEFRGINITFDIVILNIAL